MGGRRSSRSAGNDSIFWQRACADGNVRSGQRVDERLVREALDKQKQYSNVLHQDRQPSLYQILKIADPPV
jgi:hypothetical protein